MNSPIRSIGSFTSGYEVQIGRLDGQERAQYKNPAELRDLLQKLQDKANAKYGNNANLEFRLRTGTSGNVYLQLRKQTWFGKIKPMASTERARRAEDRELAIHALKQANLQGVQWPQRVGTRQEARALAQQLRQAMTPEAQKAALAAALAANELKKAELRTQKAALLEAQMGQLTGLISADLSRQQRLFDKAQAVLVDLENPPAAPVGQAPAGAPAQARAAAAQKAIPLPPGTHQAFPIGDRGFIANERGELILSERVQDEAALQPEAVKAAYAPGDPAAEGLNTTFAVAERDPKLGVLFRNLTNYLKPYENLTEASPSFFKLPALPIDPNTAPPALRELEDVRQEAERKVNEGAIKVARLCQQQKYAEAFQVLKTEQEPAERRALETLVQQARGIANKMRTQPPQQDPAHWIPPEAVATMADMLVCEYGFALTRLKSELADPKQFALKAPEQMSPEVLKAGPEGIRPAPALLIHKRLTEQLQWQLEKAAGQDPNRQGQAWGLISRASAMAQPMLAAENAMNLRIGAMAWRRTGAADAPYASWLKSAEVHGKTHDQARQQIRKFEAIKATFQQERGGGMAGLFQSIRLKPNPQALNFKGAAGPQMQKAVADAVERGEVKWSPADLSPRVDQKPTLKLLSALPSAEGLNIVRDTLGGLQCIEGTRHWSGPRALSFLDDAARRILAPFVPGGLTAQQYQALARNPEQLNALIDPPRDLDPDRPAPAFKVGNELMDKGIGLAVFEKDAQGLQGQLKANNPLNEAQTRERQLIQADPLKSRRFALELVRLIQMEHELRLQVAPTKDFVTQAREGVKVQLKALDAFVRTLPDGDVQGKALRGFLQEFESRFQKAADDISARHDDLYLLRTVAGAEVKPAEFTANLGLLQLGSRQHDQVQLAQNWIQHFDSRPATASADALNLLGRLKAMPRDELSAMPTEMLALGAELEILYEAPNAQTLGRSVRAALNERQSAQQADLPRLSGGRSGLALAQDRVPLASEWQAALGDESVVTVEPQRVPWTGSVQSWVDTLDKLVADRYAPRADQARAAPLLSPPPTLLTLDLPPDAQGRPRWVSALVNLNAQQQPERLDLLILGRQADTQDIDAKAFQPLIQAYTGRNVSLQARLLAVPDLAQPAAAAVTLKDFLGGLKPAQDFGTRLKQLNDEYAQNPAAALPNGTLKWAAMNARMLAARVPSPMDAQRLLTLDPMLQSRWSDLQVQSLPALRLRPQDIRPAAGGGPHAGQGLDPATLDPVNRFIDDLRRQGIEGHDTLGLALLTRARMSLRLDDPIVQTDLHRIRDDAIKGRQMVEQAIAELETGGGADRAERIQQLSQGLQDALNDIGEVAKVRFRDMAEPMQPARLESRVQAQVRQDWSRAGREMLAPLAKWNADTLMARIQAFGQNQAVPTPPAAAVAGAEKLHARILELSKRFNPEALAKGHADPLDLAALADLKFDLANQMKALSLWNTAQSQRMANDALNDLDAAAQLNDPWRDPQPLWERRHQMAQSMRKEIGLFVERARVESDEAQTEATRAYRDQYKRAFPNPFEEATRKLAQFGALMPDAHAPGDALAMARERCKDTLLNAQVRTQLELAATRDDGALSTEHLYTLRALEQNHQDKFLRKLKEALPAFAGEVLPSEATLERQQAALQRTQVLATQVNQAVQQWAVDPADAELDLGDLLAAEHQAMVGRTQAQLEQELASANFQIEEITQQADLKRDLGLMLHASAARMPAGDPGLASRMAMADVYLSQAQAILKALRDCPWTPSSRLPALDTALNLLSDQRASPRQQAADWLRKRATDELPPAAPNPRREQRLKHLNRIKEALPAQQHAALQKEFEKFDDARRILRQRNPEPPFALRERRLGNALEKAQEALSGMRRLIDALPQATAAEKAQKNAALEAFRGLDLDLRTGALNDAAPGHNLATIRTQHPDLPQRLRDWSSGIDRIRDLHLPQLLNNQRNKRQVEEQALKDVNDQRKVTNDIRKDALVTQALNGAMGRDAAQAQRVALKMELSRAQWYATYAERTRVLGTQPGDVPMGGGRFAQQVVSLQGQMIGGAIRGNPTPPLTREDALVGAKRYLQEAQARLKALESNAWLSDADLLDLQASKVQLQTVMNAMPKA